MTLFDIQVERTNGDKVSLSNFRGKVLLIVNTASKCKFTPQFDDLQKLYNQYREHGFEILGFPCNQFGEQEPGSNEEAASFCQINYGVTFPMFSKIDVNGNQASPLFEYLKKEAPFQGFDENNIQSKLLKMMITEKNPEWLVGDSIKWNFTKFLVNREGQVLQRYEPSVEPSDFTNDIAECIRS